MSIFTSFIRERLVETPVEVLHERPASTPRVDAATAEQLNDKLAFKQDLLDKLTFSIRGLNNRLAICFEPYNDNEQALATRLKDEEARVQVLKDEVAVLQQQILLLTKKETDEMEALSLKRMFADIDLQLKRVHTDLSNKSVSYKRELIALENAQNLLLKERFAVQTRLRELGVHV